MSNHNKHKILNDPVYGFITIQHTLSFDLMDHPYVQRLRRISQLGLSHLVYPGAVHNRFHHAIGALHLMQEAIAVLRAKGTEISDSEAEGACAAILLHDMGRHEEAIEAFDQVDLTPENVVALQKRAASLQALGLASTPEEETEEQ